MEKHLSNSLIGTNDAASLAALLSAVNETVVYADYNWVIRYCNDIYLTSLGLKREEVIGKTPFEYHPNFHRSVFHDMMEQCRRDHKPGSKIGYSTMTNRWLMVRVFPMSDGALMLANDATEGIVKQYQLAAQAIKDPLTGLPNALGLTSEMDVMIKDGKPFSLMLLGLDRFRFINDALGHAGGDMVLLEVTSRFQTSAEPGETLYRIGSDEFAVLRRQGGPLAEDSFSKFKESAELPVVLYGQSFVFGVSAGICVHPSDGHNAEELLRRAGLALRRAKRVGRGVACAYVQGLESETLLRTQLETEIREAIKEDGFHLVFQPKIDLSSGRVIGAEALIRWHHPSRGFLSPAAFLPIAMECHLIKAIDSYVLKAALGAVATWSGYGVDCPVSINLSIESLSDSRLVDQVTEALRQSNLEPALLEIEIPEGAMFNDVDSSIAILERLRGKGVRLSIDDFGTGYSSFSYLAKYPVQTLKVDQSFVAGIDVTPTHHKIVKSIIRMAHSLQLEVVAEGAETLSEVNVLKALHCNTVQGYFFSKPLELTDFIKFTMEQNASVPRMRVTSI